jgi:hypothetical protein
MMDNTRDATTRSWHFMLKELMKTIEVREQKAMIEVE